MRDRPGPSADVVVGALAIVALASGAIVVGVQRALVGEFVYVSELGGVGMPSETWFRWGFVLVVVGIALVAWIVRDVRSRGRVLDGWRPSTSLAMTAGWFLLASQVPCTMGCPAPILAGGTAQDAVHIVSAVLGFASGCWAMLQLATATDRWMRRVSAVGGLAIGGFAATGGIISLARANTDVGSTLEFVAAGLGVAWLATVVVLHVAQRVAAPSQAPDEQRSLVRAR